MINKDALVVSDCKMYFEKKMKSIRIESCLIENRDTTTKIEVNVASNNNVDLICGLGPDENYFLDKITYEEFEDFFASVCDDFIPSLKNSLNPFEFYMKTRDNGHFLSLEYKNRIVGVVGFYCNNLKICEAYINFVAVSSTMRGKGIAYNLLDKVDDVCKSFKMKCISLHTCSNPAMNLYKKHGYMVIEVEQFESLTKYHMKKLYYNDKTNNS